MAPGRGRPHAPPADPDQFTAEALEYLDALYGTAVRLARTSDAAQELVQDTYLKALRARHRFVPGTNLKAWLYTILHNTWRNRQRDGARSRVMRTAFSALDRTRRSPTGSPPSSRRSSISNFAPISIKGPMKPLRVRLSTPPSDTQTEHGPQQRELSGTLLFVLPSTSPANAAVPWEERLRWFSALRDFARE